MGEFTSRFHAARLERSGRAERNKDGFSRLLTPEGQALFRSAVAASNGHAVVIIHPFFPDREAFDHPHHRQLYNSYQKDLSIAIEDYQRRGLPLVLFEGENVFGNLDTTIKRMGGKDGQVFVVPTQEFTPSPIDRTMDVFAQQLAGLGLQEAIVTGSYLSHISGISGPRDFLGRPIPGYGSCVGLALRDLQNAGITTHLGITISPSGWITR